MTLCVTFSVEAKILLTPHQFYTFPTERPENESDTVCGVNAKFNELYLTLNTVVIHRLLCIDEIIVERTLKKILNLIDTSPILHFSPKSFVISERLGIRLIGQKSDM